MMDIRKSKCDSVIYGHLNGTVKINNCSLVTFNRMISFPIFQRIIIFKYITKRGPSICQKGLEHLTLDYLSDIEALPDLHPELHV